MKYVIYKTTNLLNDKIYIGQHQTKNVNDAYLGSGKHLKRSIKKHGKENFKKEVLYIFDTNKEMNEKEIELVTEEFCQRKDTYNIITGGEGYFGINNNTDLKNKYSKLGYKTAKEGELFDANREKYFKKANTNPDIIRQRSETSKIRYQKIKDDNGGIHPMNWQGRQHSKETKKKMSVKKKGKFKGIKSSQFGSFWVTNGFDNKKMKKDVVIPEGYYKGRV